MAQIIGVRFKEVGKVYYFDPCGIQTTVGQHVIVETARGVEYGEVAIANRDVAEGEVTKPLKKLLRVATHSDEKVVETNQKRAKEAFAICEKKIAEHKLDMKLVSVEYTFDLNKVLFYFTADGRVDFRELVKDLASVFRTRIELRQIGVRDERRFWADWASAADRCAVHRFWTIFSRYLSIWQNSRICRSIRQKFPAPAAD